MYKTLMKTIKQQRGAALLIVMMLVVLLSIFLTVTASILTANTNEAKMQENYLKAYYLAQSATDLCLAGLLQQGIGGANDTLLYHEFSTVVKPTIASTRTLTDTLALEGGTVDLTVRAITVSGERWVEIKSVAQLTDVDFEKTTTLQFQVSNPLVQKKL